MAISLEDAANKFNLALIDLITAAKAQALTEAPQTPAAPAEKTKAAKAPKADKAAAAPAAAPVEPETPKATQREVAEAITNLVKAKDRASAVAVLAQFKVTRVPELKEADYPAVLAACAAAQDEEVEDSLT